MTPARMFKLGWWLLAAAIALAIVTTPADARVHPPNRAQVEDAIHDAIELELLDEYQQPATIVPRCQRGTRGDRTRLVRWFCIVRTYTPNGDLIYRSRLRARAHRGDVATTINYWGEGLINMDDPAGWYLTTSTLAKKKRNAQRAPANRSPLAGSQRASAPSEPGAALARVKAVYRSDHTITGLDGSYVAHRLAPILDRVARHNHHGRVTRTTLACEGSDVAPMADCTLRVWRRRRLLERVYILVRRVRYHHPRVFEDYSGWVTTRQPDGRRRSLTLDTESRA